jgi:uncharacterized damage-inducible protein DinB
MIAGDPCGVTERPDREEGAMSMLERLYDHHRWANLRLIDACSSLPDASLAASAEGTYGPIRETLVHLVAASCRYVELLSGEEPFPGAVREADGWPGWERLRDAADRAGRRLGELAAAVPEGQRLVGESRRRGHFDLPAEVVLAQVLEHGAEHRTQVRAAITTLGMEPPEVDAWVWGEGL